MVTPTLRVTVADSAKVIRVDRALCERVRGEVQRDAWLALEIAAGLSAVQFGDDMLLAGAPRSRYSRRALDQRARVSGKQRGSAVSLRRRRRPGCGSCLGSRRVRMTKAGDVPQSLRDFPRRQME